MDDAEIQAERRDHMVARQIEARGVRDSRVLAAMRAVPRHRFVSQRDIHDAYADHPLLIGDGQTISQPYIVAFMSEALALRSTDRVLEIGTGCGYQTAVLAELAAEVWSVEIIPALAWRAEDLLATMGYRNVHVRTGDGYHGWPEQAPFDAILLTAAPEEVPPPLLGQLGAGGRLVAPVGSYMQALELYRYEGTNLHREPLLGVRFVPMTGRAQRR